MADLKITELDALVAQTDADLLAIVDDVAGTPVTKKITAGDLFTPGVDVTSDIATESLRWKDIFSQRTISVGGDLAGNITETGSPTNGFSTAVFGFIQDTAGTAEFKVSGTDYIMPVMMGGHLSNTDAAGSATMYAGGAGSVTFGRVYNTSYGACLIQNDSQGGIATGTARNYYAYGGNATIHNRRGVLTAGYVTGQRGNSGTIETGSTAWGATVLGTVFAYGSDCRMSCYGGGSQIGGYLWGIGGGAATGGNITMEVPQFCRGAFVNAAGTTYNSDGTVFIGVTTTGINGSFTQGAARSYGGAGSAYLQTTGDGSFAQGYSSTDYSSLNSVIEATGAGSFAQGRARQGSIISSGVGSFAQGHAHAYYTGTGIARIRATNSGAFAGGYAYAATGYTVDILASGIGSFAHGVSSYYGITASGEGSFAVGTSVDAPITASALNSAQFGLGVNALANSVQIGNAGLRFKGNVNAPGTPQNGDFWVDSSGYVNVRSNATTVPINVSKNATVVNNEVALWTGDGTLGSNGRLTWNGTTTTLTIDLAGRLQLNETITSPTVASSYGVFWVRADTPNLPIFTDDASSDQVIDPSLSEIVSIDAARTLQLSDKGKTILLTGTTARTWTFPSDTGGSAVAFPVGTLIGLESESTAAITLAITSPDTLTNSADGATPTTIAADGGAVAQKTASATWKISGDQLS